MVCMTYARPFSPICPSPMCSCLSRLDPNSPFESFRCSIFRCSNPIVLWNFESVSAALFTFSDHALPQMRDMYQCILQNVWQALVAVVWLQAVQNQNPHYFFVGPLLSSRIITSSVVSSAAFVNALINFSIPFLSPAPLWLPRCATI